MSSTVRKGATRLADVDPEILQQLNSGTLEAATLAENLATDMGKLLGTVFPELSDEADQLDPRVGVTKKMAAVAQLIFGVYGETKNAFLEGHPSDLVRGWGAYILGIIPELSLPERLERVQPFADDRHFGVREWAWLALRPHIVKDPEKAIEVLQDWTTNSSDNIRRFAVEAVRPRGVWSAHIAVLKSDPELGFRLLNPLRDDASRYVQDLSPIG